MSIFNAWIVTRHINDEISSTINVNDLTIDQDARTYEIMMVKAGLERLGVNVMLMRLIHDIQSPENVISMRDSLPDIIILRCTLWDTKIEMPIIKELENQGVIVINNSDTHFVCNDKLLQYQRLISFDVRIPKTIDIPDNLNFDSVVSLIENELEYPIVMKPKFGSAGIHTVKCNNADDVKNAYDNALSRKNLKFMVAQKWIDHNPHGIINVTTIGNEIVSCYRRLPETPVDFWNTGAIVFDHVTRLVADRKISSVKTKVATSNPDRDLFDQRKLRPTNDLRDTYPISDELKNLCQTACSALYGAEMTRMDILKDDDGYMICEVNSPPGFPGADIFFGLDVGDLIAKYALSNLKNHVHVMRSMI